MSSPLDRLLAKVVTDSVTGCWIFTGGRAGDGYDSGGGYGAFYLDGRVVGAHRASYILHVGPIPDGAQVDHTCHNADLSCPGGAPCLHRACVNPAHLEAVTQSVNQERAKERINECPAGHPYDQANTYRYNGGGRQCRKCRCASVQRAKAKRKLAS